MNTVSESCGVCEVRMHEARIRETTLDGQSLRLELDTENDTRFCRWLRETPARMHLCVALRRGPDAPVELFAAEVDGRIADQPAGPRGLGWDRLFVPGWT